MTKNKILKDIANMTYDLDPSSEVSLKPGNIDMSYIYRMNEDTFEFIRSKSTLIQEVFGVSYKEIIVIRAALTPPEEKKLVSDLFQNYYEKSKNFAFRVSHDSLKLSDCEIYLVKGTNILLLSQPIGWLCKRSDVEKVKAILESYSLTPMDYNLESLDKIFWTEKTLSLKRDVEFFSKSRKWFLSKDLPYCRSYLLYGPPGNGKTSAIRAISNYFNSEPEIFSFTAKYDDPDSSFIDWVTNGESFKQNYMLQDEYGMGEASGSNGRNPRIRILLLEDIDRFFSKDEDFKTPVTFSTILNALDGAIQRKNSIVIATANNPEKIDSQVLCRPGRFDLRVPFESPDENAIQSFLRKLTAEDSVSDEAIKDVTTICKGHSFSFVKGVYLSAANRSFANSSSTIMDRDLISAAEEFSRNLGREIKSTKSGAGF